MILNTSEVNEVSGKRPASLFQPTTLSVLASCWGHCQAEKNWPSDITQGIVSITVVILYVKGPLSFSSVSVNISLHRKTMSH